jgi:hypothetical protein
MEQQKLVKYYAVYDFDAHKWNLVTCEDQIIRGDIVFMMEDDWKIVHYNNGTEFVMYCDNLNAGTRDYKPLNSVMSVLDKHLQEAIQENIHSIYC